MISNTPLADSAAQKRAEKFAEICFGIAGLGNSRSGAFEGASAEGEDTSNVPWLGIEDGRMVTRPHTAGMTFGVPLLSMFHSFAVSDARPARDPPGRRGKFVVAAAAAFLHVSEPYPPPRLLLCSCNAICAAGDSVRKVELTDEEVAATQTLGLLTAKKVSNGQCLFALVMRVPEGSLSGPCL